MRKYPKGMSNATVADAEQEAPSEAFTINDVVMKIATPNGSGSQSANLILMRAIFEMGIPVAGKNLFPSNIQGLPTWYTIRVNDKGFLAQRRLTDIMIAMNPDSVVDDVAEVPPGGTLIIRKKLDMFARRDDITTYIVPFTDLATEVCPDAKLRNKVINVVYVGVMAWLLDIDFDAVVRAIGHQFGNKPKAVALNQSAAEAGYKWAQEHVKPHPEFRMRPSEAAKGKILIEGNEASALGMMMGGCAFAAWYPITPSSSLCEYLADFMETHRKDPVTGKNNFAIIQAEDELSAMGMVLGASWAGARSFTSTSGPGISLMAEMAGLSYFAEIPAVIVDVQRMGPSTGLPTRTCQGDVLKAYYLSHGDCRHICLLPGNAEECYEFAMESLNLAERFQTLVFLLTDLDLGMNRWLTDVFKAPSKPLDRGKVLSTADLERINEFARYRDVDGDGIPYRTLPGTDHPKAAFFTRGTGHTETAGYSEKPDNWKNNMDRLVRKFDTARQAVPAPIVDKSANAKIGIIAYGSSDLPVAEARAWLRDHNAIETDYLRLRALPVNSAVREFITHHDKTYVVEQNRDGQVIGILRTEYPELATKMEPVLHYNGIPLDAQTVVEGILAHIQK